MASLRVGPAIVTLQANDPPAGKLIITARLDSADYAAGVVTAQRCTRGSPREWERPAGHRRDPRRRQSGILPDPKAANVTAEVAARPTVGVDDRWRLVRRLERHIGGKSRHAHADCDEPHACEQILFHFAP